VNLSPPLTPTSDIAPAIEHNGFAIAAAASVAELTNVSVSDLLDLRVHWQDLPRDPYLKDGGRYRFRRHASYTVSGSELKMVPHRAHWQSVDYNALHGGIERWFEPITPALADNVCWQPGLLKRINFASIRAMALVGRLRRVPTGMVSILLLYF
jgi:hypothetical protein